MMNRESLIARQAAAIEELVSLVGYLPEAYAVLDRYGLRDEAEAAVDGPSSTIEPDGWQDWGDCAPC